MPDFWMYQIYKYSSKLFTINPSIQWSDMKLQNVHVSDLFHQENSFCWYLQIQKSSQLSVYF